jgi:phospholipase/carboxylesterase
MEKKNQLSFIDRFIPSKNKRSGTRTRTNEQGSKVFTTLLLFHGTGVNEDDLIPLANELDQRAAIFSPKGKVLENGMPRFFGRLAERVFDIEDLKFRTNELADFVKDASKAYHFNLQRLVAIHYSNGANIAASMLLLRPERRRTVQ